MLHGPFTSALLRCASSRTCHLYHNEGLTQTEIARAFGEHPNRDTVCRILCEHQATGEVAAPKGKKGTRKKRKFDEIAAQTLVELVQADDQHAKTA